MYVRQNIIHYIFVIFLQQQAFDFITYAVDIPLLGLAW